MKKIINILRLPFIPRSTDLGLLLLRLWTGLAMLVLHGWGKLTNYSTLTESFPDPLGIGNAASLAFAVFAEVVCSVLIIAGAFTRLAALSLLFTMGVAWLMVHGGALSGPESGELAAVYLVAYAVLFVAGAGHYSVDRKSEVDR